MQQHPNTTARVFNYKRSLTSLGSFDGIDYLEIPQRTNVSRPHTLMVQAASITSNIPNVYDATGLTTLPTSERINTGLCAISKDGGVNWTAIQLANGVYTPLNISNAINATVPAGWYINDADPAFTLHSNSVVGLCYIIIDSAKMVGGAQFAINFGYNGSRMGELLGFVAASSFNADGTHQSDAYPKLDWFGNYVDVHIADYGPLSVEAGKSSDCAVSIKLESSSSVNSYSYPLTTGEITYERPCRPPETINDIKLHFKGRNRTILAFDGEVSVIIILKEY